MEILDSSYSGAYQGANEVTYLVLFYVTLLQFIIQVYC
jgi:hypothetical protein